MAFLIRLTQFKLKSLLKHCCEKHVPYCFSSIDHFSATGHIESIFFTVNLFDVCLSELLQNTILEVIFQTEGGRLLLIIKCLCS